MKSITVRDLSVSVWDLLCKLVRPARRLKAPPRPRSIRLALEGLEDRTVPSPIVTGLSPNFGPVSGGTAVEIAGSGFTGTTAVDFGSDITEYQVVSDTQIDVRSPGESAGVVDVTVTTPSGTSPTSSADQFTYGTTTTTTLSSSADPSSFNQSVTFTATVSPNGSGTPTGTVTFMDGSTALGTGTLSGGLATFATSALAIGTHPVTAVYSGDSNFLGSTSSVLTQNVDSATAYIWTGADSNDWSTAGNWDVNGQPATVPPVQATTCCSAAWKERELDSRDEWGGDGFRQLDHHRLVLHGHAHPQRRPGRGERRIHHGGRRHRPARNNDPRDGRGHQLERRRPEHQRHLGDAVRSE